MPTADQFNNALHRIMLEAMRQGRASVEVSAGYLHRRVGDYPGTNHRMSVCCQVMRAAFSPAAGDVIVGEPPSGQGASLTIRYGLPRLEEAPGGALGYASVLQSVRRVTTSRI